MSVNNIDSKSKVAVKGGYFCLTCNRCDHVWYSKCVKPDGAAKDPKTCGNPVCKSPYWNKIRVR